MDHTEYLNKCQTVLNNRLKFSLVIRNPVQDLKKKINNQVNTGEVKFQQAVVDYYPVYFYGNVKTRKPGNALRAIASQIPIPTYQLTKQLNK